MAATFWGIVSQWKLQEVLLMAVTARSGEPAAEVVDATAVEAVILVEMTAEVEAAIVEVAIAPFGWTNMDHQPERIIVLLLRTFQAE